MPVKRTPPARSTTPPAKTVMPAARPDGPRCGSCGTRTPEHTSECKAWAPRSLAEKYYNRCHQLETRIELHNGSAPDEWRIPL
jgi:hypothetical protein